MKFAHILRDDDGKAYGSYVDFYRLADLSGYPIIHQSQIEWDNPNETYILCPLNGAVLEWAKQPRQCKLIGWQLERFSKWNTYQSGPFIPGTFD
jgi:hypothetical protein